MERHTKADITITARHRAALTPIWTSAQYPGDFKALQDDLRTITEKLNQTLGGIAAATSLPFP